VDPPAFVGAVHPSPDFRMVMRCGNSCHRAFFQLFGVSEMGKFSLLPAALVGASLLAACAPKPAPVMPEPVFDKFGNPEMVCLSDAMRRDPNNTFPTTLPRCEDLCEEGTRPAAATVAGQMPQCIPIPRDDDGGDDGRQPDPQRPGTVAIN
jgi:hypothetical protein